jgi:hypothetical protein
MRGFSNTFLIFFYQIAWGGLVALAATPFHELDRAFYKSTAGVLFVIAVIEIWGKSAFYWRTLSERFDPVVIAEIFFHALFAASFAAYLVSLWGERQTLRARSFATAVLGGFAGLILSAGTFHAAPLVSFETMIYPVSFVLSALLLGSVTVGMLIGHWYLIDTGQTLEPFVRVYKYFMLALIVQAIFLLLSAALLHVLGSPDTASAVQRLWTSHATLLAMRVLAGQVAPLILAWMIWRTLLIPHTMAATGLFYIALLGVFIGDILGKQILALTGLPF